MPYKKSAAASGSYFAALLATSRDLSYVVFVVSDVSFYGLFYYGFLCFDRLLTAVWVVAASSARATVPPMKARPSIRLINFFILPILL